MEKVLFFTSYPISHIYPLAGLIGNLISNNYIVYVLSDIKNKDLIESYGANFLQYPFDFTESCYENDMNNYRMKCIEYAQQGKHKEALEEYLKFDIASVMNVNSTRKKQIKKIVESINPNIIFRDAVDHFGKIIANEMNINVIGYMTNNMYSINFLKTNPNYLCKIFMNGFEMEKYLGINYFENFIDIELNLYKKVEKELCAEHIQPLNQFNLDEEFNIIFSLDELQPKSSFFKNKEYLIIKPSNKNFRVNNEVEKDIKTFLETDKKIIYIATGSIVTRDISYYETIIDELSKIDVKLIISAGDKTSYLRNYVKKKNIEKNIMIKEFLPQIYILSKVNLFITSGGFNSILESIFHRCPMLILPIASEQRLNGYIIAKRKLGATIYGERNLKKYLLRTTKQVMNDGVIKENLKTISLNMQNENINYDKLYTYLNKKKNV